MTAILHGTLSPELGMFCRVKIGVLKIGVVRGLIGAFLALGYAQLDRLREG